MDDRRWMLGMGRVTRRALILSAVFTLASSVAFGDSSRIARAFALIDGGEFAEARGLIDAELARSPDDADALILLGQAYLGLRHHEAAMASLEKAVAARPESSDGHLWLARAAAAAGQNANLISRARLARTTRRELRRAIDLDPGNVEASLDLIHFYLVAPGIVGGSTDRAHAEAGRLGRTSRGDAQLGLGLIAWHEERFDDASIHFRSATRSAIARRRAWLWLGYVSQKLQRWEEAFDAHEALGELSGAEMHASFETGRTASFSGLRLDEGRACLERYTRHKPSLGEPRVVEAFVYLGRLERRAGNVERARGHFLTAARLDPHSEEIRREIAVTP